MRPGPEGGSASARNTALGFLLPDGSVRSPDASAVRLERWQALRDAEQEGFPPFCPDLVVELASPSDPLEDLRRTMASYRANGARLGWLLRLQTCSVEVWEAGGGEPQVLSNPNRLEAAGGRGPDLPDASYLPGQWRQRPLSGEQNQPPCSRAVAPRWLCPIHGRNHSGTRKPSSRVLWPWPSRRAIVGSS